MPNAIILELDSYRRRRTGRFKSEWFRELAPDMCEEAFKRRDWTAFDRWFRVLTMTRQSYERLTTEN